MGKQRNDDEDLAEMIAAYRQFGAELQRMPPTERRQLVGVIVRTLGEACPVAVADLAGCASLLMLRVGGAQ